MLSMSNINRYTNSLASTTCQWGTQYHDAPFSAAHEITDFFPHFYYTPSCWWFFWKFLMLHAQRLLRWFDFTFWVCFKHRCPLLSQATPRVTIEPLCIYSINQTNTWIVFNQHARYCSHKCKYCLPVVPKQSRTLMLWQGFSPYHNSLIRRT